MAPRLYILAALLCSLRSMALVPCEEKQFQLNRSLAPILSELGHRSRSEAWHGVLERVSQIKAPLSAEFQALHNNYGKIDADTVIYKGHRYKIPNFHRESIVRAAVGEVLVLEGAHGSLAFVPLFGVGFNGRSKQWEPTGMGVWFLDGQKRVLRSIPLFEFVERRDIRAFRPLSSGDIVVDLSNPNLQEATDFRIQYDARGAFVRSFTIRSEKRYLIQVRLGINEAGDDLLQEAIPLRSLDVAAEITLGRAGLFSNELIYRALSGEKPYQAALKVAELELEKDLKIEILLISKGDKRRLAISFALGASVPQDSLARQILIRKGLLSLGLSYPSLMNQGSPGLGLEQLARGDLILLDALTDDAAPLHE